MTRLLQQDWSMFTASSESRIESRLFLLVDPNRCKGSRGEGEGAWLHCLPPGVGGVFEDSRHFDHKRNERSNLARCLPQDIFSRKQ